MKAEYRGEQNDVLMRRGNRGIQIGVPSFSVNAACCALLILTFSGCSQTFWRKQADKDTYRALLQTETDARWVNPRKGITPDPRSRFFDPYDPDHEPLPPDDPAAAVYMENVNGIAGYKSWHKLGQSFSIENPGWLAQFELTPEMVDDDPDNDTKPLPTIKNLTIRDAVELSYIHDRGYQTELENTYLSALALTLERFRFQVRYLGVGGREPSASLTQTTVPNTSDSLGMSNRFGVSQLLPTGGQWAVELANNTLWLFSGANAGTSSASILSYRITQPLLLNAGRKIALADLTQAERDLLYSVRSLARFRKQLFVNTVGGGYLGLLTQIQGIRNQKFNITQLERQVRALRALASEPPAMTDTDLEAMPAGIVIPEKLQGRFVYDEKRKKLYWFKAMSQEEAEALLALSDDPAWKRSIRDLIQIKRTEATPLDVAQLESRLASARINLRTSERRFKDQLDQFKIQLGLPPDLVMTIDDSSLEQFQLISPVLEKMRTQADTLVEQLGLIDEEAPNVQQIREALSQLQQYAEAIDQQGIQLVKQDALRVNANMGKRLEAIKSEQERTRITKTVERDQDRVQEQIDRIEQQKKNLQSILQRLNSANGNLETLKGVISDMKDAREDLEKQVLELQVIQIGLRSELISVNRFDLSMADSVGVALENRLDLMNERANVMDARRDWEVVANRLKSVLDVAVEGDVRTPVGGSQPFNFSGSSSSYRLGLQFTAPLDQVAERNNYRSAQIRYQRARRAYMAAEDQVKLQVRTAWRQLQVLEENLETARQALRINVLQYDQAVETANAPGQPAQGGVSGRNLIDALNNILAAQDRLIQIWANYETQRLNIHRDMGMMEIDPQGMWIDPYYQNQINPPQESSHEHDSSTTDGPDFEGAGSDSAGFDVVLLPPAPIENVNFETGQGAKGEERGSEPSQSPVVEALREFPASSTKRLSGKKEEAFVADPLGWHPVSGSGDLFFRGDADRKKHSGE